MIARAVRCAWLLSALLPGAVAAAPSKEADAAPAAEPPPRRVVVRVAELHLGDGRVHAPGALLVEGGRIKALGPSVDAPEGAEVWDEPTGILTPWLVDPSVRIPLGPGESGKIDAALLTTADARPMWDPMLPELREQGLFAMELVPEGGAELLGRSVVVGTAGPGPAGAPVLVSDAHLAIGAPSITGSTGAAAARQSLADALDATDRYVKARAAWKKEHPRAHRPGIEPSDERSLRDDVGPRAPIADDDKEPPLEPAREVLARVNAKTLPLRIRVDRATDVTGLLALAKKRGVTMVLAGCRECGAIAQQVGESQQSVVLEPARESAAESGGLPLDADLASKLAKAGARVAVSAGGDFPSSPAWLRIMAADLAGAGMPRNLAIAAMTGEAARAAALPDPVIATGQPARFLVWDRDPLDPVAKPTRRVVPEDLGFKAPPPMGPEAKDEGRATARQGLGR